MGEWVKIGEWGERSVMQDGASGRYEHGLQLTAGFAGEPLGMVAQFTGGPGAHGKLHSLLGALKRGRLQ